MHNLVLLIGRLVNEPELVKTETGKKVLTIRLAVQRNFKNPDGIYEADFIRCKLWDGIAERTCEYCHKGDLIAVRGQLRTESYEDDKKEKKYITEVIVDRLNFLVTNKEKEINIDFTYILLLFCCSRLLCINKVCSYRRKSKSRTSCMGC